jgi:hypothetical protein
VLQRPARFLPGVWSSRNSADSGATFMHTHIQTSAVCLHPVPAFSRIVTIKTHYLPKQPLPIEIYNETCVLFDDAVIF